MSKGTTSQDAPFGTLLGYAPGGVAIYSSDYSSLDPRSNRSTCFLQRHFCRQLTMAVDDN